MYIFHRTKDLKVFLNTLRANGNSIGYTPTMGALHNGHISLINASKLNNDISVCSIFVNPTQFNNAEDLQKYPKTVDADIYSLTQANCDILFLPEIAEMYPNGLEEASYYDLGTVETILEGEFRPGHFQGVAQVVDKFLNIIQPDQLYMGQKDYQQCAVISKLIALQNHQTKLNRVPTAREADGLAMSSRNMRLTEKERQLSNIIYQCLVSIQAQKEHKPYLTVKKECWDLLLHKGITPEYITLCNAETLDTLEEYNNELPMVVLIAAYVGAVRLIDNLVI